MKYFNYQCANSLGSVWSLFSELSTLSQGECRHTDSRWDYSHTTEIISSALNGNLNPYDFDLKAYEIACCKTDDIEASKMRKKYLTIVDNVNGNDDSATVGYGEISSNDKRLKTVEDAFELFDSDEDFESYLRELYNIRKDYIVDKGVDLVEMLSNSLKGIPEAMESISELCSEDSVLKTLVGGLCEKGDRNLQVRLEGAF